MPSVVDLTTHFWDSIARAFAWSKCWAGIFFPYQLSLLIWIINPVFLVLSTKVSLKDNSQQINPEKGICWIKTFFCDFSPLVSDELGILKNSLKFFNKLSKGWNSPKGTKFLLSYLSFVEVLIIEVKIFSSCWTKKPPIISISANSVLAWKFW